MNTATGKSAQASAAFRAHEMRFGRSLREVFLSGHYDGWSKEAIAVDLGVSVRTLDHWMSRCGVGFQRVVVDLHAENDAGAGLAETENGKAVA